MPEETIDKQISLVGDTVVELANMRHRMLKGEQVADQDLWSALYCILQTPVSGSFDALALIVVANSLLIGFPNLDGEEDMGQALELVQVYLGKAISALEAQTGCSADSFTGVLRTVN